MLANTWGAVVRHRWLSVLVVVLVANVAGAVFLLLPPQQESKAQVLFLPPLVQAGVTGEVNPFLSLGGSMGTTASIVMVRVGDDATRARLAAAGATATYTVEPNLGENAGPILLVKATGQDSEVVQRTMTAVVAEIQGQMQSLQRAVPAPNGSFITTTVLTQYPAPVPVYTRPLRFAVAAGGGVFVVLGGALLFWDRRQRRAVADSDVTDQQP